MQGTQTGIEVTEDHMAYAFHRVRQAVRTLRKVPHSGAGPGRCTSWPDIVQEFWDAYGYSDPTPPKLVPTAKQISEMDEVLAWLGWLGRRHGRDAVRVVWAKAEGYPERRIAKTLGRSRSYVQTRFWEGVYLLAREFVTK